MASKEKREKIFSSYPIPKAVAALALPSVLSSIVNVIYNMADTYFVSLMKNTNATAAVSLTMPVFLFLWHSATFSAWAEAPILQDPWARERKTELKK